MVGCRIIFDNGCMWTNSQIMTQLCKLRVMAFMPKTVETRQMQIVLTANTIQLYYNYKVIHVDMFPGLGCICAM